MSHDMKKNVSLSTFQPKRYGQKDYEKAPLKLGTLIGIAKKIKIVENAVDPSSPYTGLAGVFKAIIGDPADGNSVTSGVCFLPDAWLGPICDALSDVTDPETGEVVQHGASEVKFAFGIAIEKADNPAGYSWVLTNLIATSANDPLASVMAEANVSIAPREEKAQIEGPKGKKAA